MTGFEVDIAGLSKAADAAVSAGDQARKVNLGDGPDGVPAGMPGSESASKAGSLAESWDKRLGTWADDMGQFGESLSAAADHYLADDEAAERDFSLLGWLFR
jgi:hypothetical protein